MNNWVVWDNKEQYFAEVGTRHLLSLPKERAKAFCTMLNILLSKNDAARPLQSAELGAHSVSDQYHAEAAPAQV
jgi:hypothetical protein